MRNRRRIAIIAGIVIVACIVFTVGTTVVLNLTPKPLQPLSTVSYNQTKAVPGWDDATMTTTDPAQLAALHDVLVKDGWTPGSSAANNGCAGGLATNLALTFTDGSHAKLHVYQCGRDSNALTDDVSALVSQWRGAKS